MTVNASTLARKFAIANKTVHAWVKEGCPRNADKSFDVEKVLAWRRAKLGESQNDPSVRAAGAKSALQAKRLMLQCEQLETSIFITKGKLLPADEVRREVTRIFQSVKQRFLALPNEAAPLLAGLSSAEAERLLRERVIKILEGVSDHEWMRTAQ